MMLRVDVRLTDAIVDVLEPFAYQGISIEHDGIPPDKLDEDEIPPPTHQILRVYLPDDARVEQQKDAINTVLASFNVEQPLYRIISEQDWAEAWKAHYHALRLGENIVVRPKWEETTLKPGDVEIILDPGMAFGTGTHPTTQLCLEAIERLMPKNARVIDLGCGSGILSIAAAKLGAASVYAIDIDEVATQAAAANFQFNHTTEKTTLATGGLPEVLALNQSFDFAAVNILARIIIEMCQNRLGDIIRPGGTAIFAGLIEDQVDEVETALREAGFTPQRRYQRQDWILIEAVR